jgi:uncharacterized protein YdaL
MQLTVQYFRANDTVIFCCIDLLQQRGPGSLLTGAKNHIRFILSGLVFTLFMP